MIKTVLQTALFSACVFCSQNIFAWTNSFSNEQTECWVFKADQLVENTSCIYNGDRSGDITGKYGSASGNFYIKGYGEMSYLSTNQGYSVNFINRCYDLRCSGEDDEPTINVGIMTSFLNGEKANKRYRDKDSLVVISKKEADRRTQVWLDKGNKYGWENIGAKDLDVIECYKEVETTLEFCFLDAVMN